MSNLSHFELAYPYTVLQSTREHTPHCTHTLNLKHAQTHNEIPHTPALPFRIANSTRPLLPDKVAAQTSCSQQAATA